MISKEEIKKLADLARIDITDGDIEGLRGDMDAILDYVGQVKSVQELSGTKEKTEIKEELVNVMRADENPTDPGTYNQALIAEFPHKDGDYLKVKKIL
ncbi:MAG: Asp-tRNA(Asn)/Glu-tRNA(Gln) amidotransferase subunit GatC [Candidatus Paceibacterota bacterium]|jgi:aspartyl-tRNA(Asn)/glutamyl-tRNA(Gln) amidotransferase subunit C